jgi:Flp pilus assembly pilin Flp
LIGALIAVVIAASVVTVGSSLNTLFTSVANCFPSGAC